MSMSSRPNDTDEGSNDECEFTIEEEQRPSLEQLHANKQLRKQLREAREKKQDEQKPKDEPTQPDSHAQNASPPTTFDPWFNPNDVAVFHGAVIELDAFIKKEKKNDLKKYSASLEAINSQFNKLTSINTSIIANGPYQSQSKESKNNDSAQLNFINELSDTSIFEIFNTIKTQLEVLRAASIKLFRDEKGHKYLQDVLLSSDHLLEKHVIKKNNLQQEWLTKIFNEFEQTKNALQETKNELETINEKLKSLTTNIPTYEVTLEKMKNEMTAKENTLRECKDIVTQDDLHISSHRCLLQIDQASHDNAELIAISILTWAKVALQYQKDMRPASNEAKFKFNLPSLELHNLFIETLVEVQLLQDLEITHATIIHFLRQQITYLELCNHKEDPTKLGRAYTDMVEITVAAEKKLGLDKTAKHFKII